MRANLFLIANLKYAKKSIVYWSHVLGEVVGLSLGHGCGRVSKVQVHKNETDEGDKMQKYNQAVSFQSRKDYSHISLRPFVNELEKE